VFSAKSQQGRDAVLALLRELREARLSEKRTPGLMVLDRWGDWRRRADLPARPLESVIVKGTVIDDLFSDLEEFIGQEADYVRRAIPYHRAYLLVGPPGTGKTSAVKAVTNALGLDLWYAQLSGSTRTPSWPTCSATSAPAASSCWRTSTRCPRRSTARDEDAPDEGDISTSGLLNALDGVATPHGLISIMTTNHPEHLDPALMRPGRIDRVFAFEYPDSHDDPPALRVLLRAARHVLRRLAGGALQRRGLRDLQASHARTPRRGGGTPPASYRGRGAGLAERQPRFIFRTARACRAEWRTTTLTGSLVHQCRRAPAGPR
jgi:DNA polymerase III delta prime subunit